MLGDRTFLLGLIPLVLVPVKCTEHRIGARNDRESDKSETHGACQASAAERSKRKSSLIVQSRVCRLGWDDGITQLADGYYLYLSLRTAARILVCQAPRV
jgi:hypothetical protein